MNHTFHELADMHFMYGRANGNSREARRLYQQQFPNRILPHHTMFTRIHRNLQETGSLKPNRREIGGPRNRRAVEVENRVINHLEANPRASIRTIARLEELPRTAVWTIVKEHQFYPYHFQRVQGLTPNDFQPRRLFCTWFLRQRVEIPGLEAMVLWSDEAGFGRDGVFNFHNEHYYDFENPHVIRQGRHQHQFSLNVWAGIVGNELIGPFFLPPRLNQQNYLNFLTNELPGLLEDVPLVLRRRMWFMHDGAPAHFALNVRQFLNETYGNRWIGRGGPNSWPARSPDLNPLDFYFWGHIKSLVYDTEVPNVEILEQRIRQGFTTIRAIPGTLERVRQSLIRRVHSCLNQNGGHFEHLL